MNHNRLYAREVTRSWAFRDSSILPILCLPVHWQHIGYSFWCFLEEAVLSLAESDEAGTSEGGLE